MAGRLGDAEVSLRPVHPDLPWTGLAARTRKIPQNRFWRIGDLGSGIMIRDYLDAVLPTWKTMAEDERRDVRIGVGILRALPVELEAAVVVGAMGLEHLARALLPPAEDGYELSRSQRAKVRSQLAAFAPGSDWLRDLPLLVGHAIAVCLLRKLGYEGAVYDVREARTYR